MEEHKIMHIKCPICGSSNIISNINYFFYKCSYCHCEFAKEVGFFDYSNERTHTRYEIKFVMQEIENKLNIENAKYIKVLEIGCGDGRHLYRLIKTYGNILDIYGSDLHNMLAYRSIKFIDINELFDTYLKFDIIFCFHTLEHVEDPVNFMKKLFFLLKNNGSLILSVPNPERTISKIFKQEKWDRPPYHLYRFYPETFNFLKSHLKYCHLQVFETTISVFDIYIYIFNIEDFLSSLYSKAYSRIFLRNKEQSKVFKNNVSKKLQKTKKIKRFVIKITATISALILFVIFKLLGVFNDSFNKGLSLVVIIKK